MNTESGLPVSLGLLVYLTTGTAGRCAVASTYARR